MASTKLLALVRRRRAGFGHQPCVVVRAECEDEDISAEEAAGHIGPDTVVVSIVRFDEEMHGTPLKCR